MAIKKSELYSSLWASCDALREGWEWQSRKGAGDARLDASVYPVCEDDVAKYVAQ